MSNQVEEALFAFKLAQDIDVAAFTGHTPGKRSEESGVSDFMPPQYRDDLSSEIFRYILHGSLCLQLIL